MSNHVKLEIDGRVEFDGDVDNVTLSRNYETGAITFQGGPPTGRAAGGGLASGLTGAGLQGLAATLKQRSKEAGERARESAAAVEAQPKAADG